MIDPGTIFSTAAGSLPGMFGGGGRTSVSTSTQTSVATSLNISPTIANQIGGSGSVAPSSTGSAGASPYLSGSSAANQGADSSYPFASLLNPRGSAVTRPTIDPALGRVSPNQAAMMGFGQDDGLIWLLLIGGAALLFFTSGK